VAHQGGTQWGNNQQVSTIQLEHSGPVAILTLDRPEAMNAISTQFALDLTEAAHNVAADESVRAVVLRSSSERAFCVGADLKERNGFTDEDLLAQRPVFRRLFGSIIALPVPVVSAVSGFALGGGCELALGGDLIVADDGAVFGLPEVAVGLIPAGGGTQRLARRVGPARAADLIFTGRRVPVDEAVGLGLVDRRVTGAGQAGAAAVELAEQIARNSPIALRQAKLALRTGVDRPLAEGLDVEDAGWRTAAFSPDRAEGIRAFVEKRSPILGSGFPR
jgi:enoyl-CoA hydratase/carnithine racemase